jgi:hypothetical protein
MTPALLLVRDCIVYSVNVWLVPVEYAFNMIEAELVRRGAQLYPDANSPRRAPLMIGPGSRNDLAGPARPFRHQTHAPASAAMGHLKSRRKQHMASTSGRTADERSLIAPTGLQRWSRAL